MIEEVNKRSDGQLTIDYLGGPEVIPPMQQEKAVQSGMVDMGVVIGDHYATLVPPVTWILRSRLTEEQERELGGVYNQLEELHRKVGLFYLDRQISWPDHFLPSIHKHTG